MKEDKDMKQNPVRVLGFGLLLFLLSGGAPAQQGTPPTSTAQQSTQVQGQEAPLTNAEVVKLCNLGLGDEVVIAKINQAKAVDFKLETDNLVELKQQGVSKDVIAAMLKRATPSNATKATSSSSGPGQISVRLEVGGAEFALTKVMGQSSANMMGMMYLDYPGAAAKIRLQDRSPSVLVQSDTDPSSQIFVGKLDSSKKKAMRSLKMGHGGYFGRKSDNVPDPDWTVKFETGESSAGWWRLKLLKPLAPGEYGVYVANPNLFNVGELYDFGVD